MMTAASLVNNGSLKAYDRARAALKPTMIYRLTDVSSLVCDSFAKMWEGKTVVCETPA